MITRIRTLCRAALVLCLLASLGACNRSSGRLPNPVQSKDGVSYVPIDGTAFLIPEKTWLKGTVHKSTDGLVATIVLHATVPDAQPWSQQRHAEMYPPAGAGKILDIHIQGEKEGEGRSRFHQGMQQVWPERKFIEEPSDQAAQGLRRFREVWQFYANAAEESMAVRQRGQAFVEERRKDAGKPMMGTVYYEYTEDNQVKYFIYCNDSPGGIWQFCHLRFPWGQTLMIDIQFARRYMANIVAMTDKVSDRLREFEANGLARKAAMATTATPSPQPARP